MNISLESRPVFRNHGGSTDEGDAPVRVTRRLSIPDVFEQSSSKLSTGFLDLKKQNNLAVNKGDNSKSVTGKDKKVKIVPPSPPRKESYEFEKVRRNHEDTDDRAHVDFFRPKRQYMSHQRRASLPSSTTTTTTTKPNGKTMAERLKQARKSFHSSLPSNLDLLSATVVNLTDFERKRKAQEKEEGALYSASRVTERASKCWKRRSSAAVLAPLAFLLDENDTDDEKGPKEKKSKKARRRSSLADLLERDAHKLIDSVVDNTEAEEKETKFRRKNKKEKQEKSKNEEQEQEVSRRDEAADESYQELPYKISVQAVNEQKLREVFQKQNVEAAKKKKELEEDEDLTESETKEDSKAEADEDDNEPEEETPANFDDQSTITFESSLLRQEQLRLLKVALKKAAASKDPALMSLVAFENSKPVKQQQSRRLSMPQMPTTSHELTDGEEADRAAGIEDRRVHMVRRASAPDFSSTVAALMQHGSNPEEALKEMSTMPKHLLADIITAPEVVDKRQQQQDSRSNDDDDDDSKHVDEEPSPEEQGATTKKKKKGKKKKQSQRSSMPELARREDDDGESLLPTTKSSSDHHPTKRKSGKKKGKGRRKADRQASMPDLSQLAKEDVVYYDWALAARKQKKERSKDKNAGAVSGGEWKHIKSNENAVRRPKDEQIEPLKVKEEIASASSCLVKLEALLPLVESSKKRL